MPDVDAAPDRIPEGHRLENKPLVEAIFELRWALQGQQPGIAPSIRLPDGWSAREKRMSIHYHRCRSSHRGLDLYADGE